VQMRSQSSKQDACTTEIAAAMPEQGCLSCAPIQACNLAPDHTARLKIAPRTGTGATRRPLQKVFVIQDARYTCFLRDIHPLPQNSRLRYFVFKAQLACSTR
jgi:hypothetical protein